MAPTTKIEKPTKSMLKKFIAPKQKMSRSLKSNIESNTTYVSEEEENPIDSAANIQSPWQSLRGKQNLRNCCQLNAKEQEIKSGKHEFESPGLFKAIQSEESAGQIPMAKKVGKSVPPVPPVPCYTNPIQQYDTNNTIV